MFNSVIKNYREIRETQWGRDTGSEEVEMESKPRGEVLVVRKMKQKQEERYC